MTNPKQIAGEERTLLEMAAKTTAPSSQFFVVVKTGGSAVMFIPNPKADPHIEWSMRYARDLNNPDCGRFSAAAILDSFDYLLSSHINMTEATRRLRILRTARAAASIGASMKEEQA